MAKSKKATTKKKKAAPKKAHIHIDSRTYRQVVPHDGRRITVVPPPDKTKYKVI
jgi:hypothetical protein